MSEGKIAKAFDAFLGPNRGEGMDMRELFNLRAAVHVGANVVLQAVARADMRAGKREDWDAFVALKKEVDDNHAFHRLWMTPPANNLRH